MFRHEAAPRRRRGSPANVARPPALGTDLVEHPLEIRLDERPGAHVLGLFLAPDDVGLAETAELGAQRLGREGIELLDPEKVDVVDAALLALLVEVIIDLARAK